MERRVKVIMDEIERDPDVDLVDDVVIEGGEKPLTMDQLEVRNINI